MNYTDEKEVIWGREGNVPLMERIQRLDGMAFEGGSGTGVSEGKFS